MSRTLTESEKEELISEVKELKPKVAELQDSQVSTARHEVKSGSGPLAEWGTRVLKKYADKGHEGAQRAVNELGIEMAAAEQTPQANAAGTVGREDPYRKKSLEERAQKHNAFGPGNENSPYDDGSPAANTAGGNVGPASSGSFADYNMSANADSARPVRLVDSPEKGETVHMYDSSESGAVREASANGAEEVRIVDFKENPEQTVDADPIFIAERQSSAGSFASHNSRPETVMIAVNPEQLP